MLTYSRHAALPRDLSSSNMDAQNSGEDSDAGGVNAVDVAAAAAATEENQEMSPIVSGATMNSEAKAMVVYLQQTFGSIGI